MFSLFLFCGALDVIVECVIITIIIFRKVVYFLLYAYVFVKYSMAIFRASKEAPFTCEHRARL